MEKKKITLPIGNNKALVFEPEPGNKEDQDFAKRCKEVAATHPQSIQEFFIRLNQLQQEQETKMQEENKTANVCNEDPAKNTKNNLNNLKTENHGRIKKKDHQL